MCFTREISGGFGALGAIMTIDQIRRYQKGESRHPTQIFVYLLYTVMETFQFIQHLHGFDSCDATNAGLTLFGHFLIWAQPIILNLHSYYYCSNRDRILFRYSLFTSCFALCFSSFALYIGYQKSLTGSFPMTQETLNNVGPQLCTMQGPDDLHFSWYFPYDALLGYRPLGFAWGILAVMPHFFTRDHV